MKDQRLQDALRKANTTRIPSKIETLAVMIVTILVLTIILIAAAITILTLIQP
mgnify:CR=1 FL=1